MKSVNFVQKLVFGKIFFLSKSVQKKFRNSKTFVNTRKGRNTNMNKINYYKTNEILNHRYYQIPQELFVNSLYKDNLNSDSKLLYGFLLDRLTLSQKKGWYDSNRNVYLIFTRLEVADKLGLSEKTSSKAFAQLSATGLIEEKRQGLGKPNLIYVGKIQHEEITDTQKLQVLNRKIYGSGAVDSTVLEQENLPAINPNNIKPNIINTESINPNRNNWEISLDEVKEKCQLNDFEEKDKSVLENVIENLYYAPTLKVGAVTVNNPKILSMLRLIVKNNLIRLLDIIESSSNVTNITNYLMICLYNNLGNTSLPIKKETSFSASKNTNRTYEDLDLDRLYANLSMDNALATS